MQLEDYFDFLSPDDIRIKGHRHGIETILYEYIHRARPPEEIIRDYPTLELEQVYATILYYLRNKPQVEKYMSDWIEHGRQARASQSKKYLPIRDRLQLLKAERAAASGVKA